MRALSAINSLTAQLILSFIVVVLLTAVSGGLPAVWLIYEQLDQQAWSQVDQGCRVTETLYSARKNELENLAILTAQRPTLRELLTSGNHARLENYLYVLQEGAELDLVLVCHDNQAILVSNQIYKDEDLCNIWSEGGYQKRLSNTQTELWLTASQPIQPEGSDGQVIIGILLDDLFVNQMRNQTGLEQSLLVDMQPVASSVADNFEIVEVKKGAPEQEDSLSFHNIFQFGGHPYYSARFSLNNKDVEALVSLSVTAMYATQKRLIWILIISILTVAAIVSLLGALLARQISQPLVSLAETAEKFRGGDLSASVQVDTPVREVKEVAQALEDARIDLARTLNNFEREKAWVDQLLASIVEGIIALDHDGLITYFSEGAERITGWNRDEVLYHHCDEVFTTPERDPAFSQSLPVPGLRNKVVVELAGGKSSTLSISQAQLAPSELSDTEIALVFRDVSEEVLIHRLLGDFLANISHEFRTPLSALAASIELLMDQAPDLSRDELQELLNSIYLGTLGLQTLVDNLLESASIEACRFRVSPRCSDLRGIIAKATQTMQPLLEKYHQRLVVEIPASIPDVFADSRRIEQVLVNLLSNASKYGPSNAKIKILVLMDQEMVKVQVTDRGPGISKNQREMVFYRFTRPGPITNSAKMGAGLGLSVVKAVVEAHGGKVGVDDNPGGGASFWFTLPVEIEK